MSENIRAEKKVVTKEQLGIEVEGYESGEIVEAEREER